MKWIKIILAALMAAFGKYEETSDVTVDSAQIKAAQNEVSLKTRTVEQVAARGLEHVAQVEAQGHEEVAHADPNKAAQDAVNDFLKHRQERHG